MVRSGPSVDELLLRIQELEWDKKELRIRVKIEIGTLLAENERLRREVAALKAGTKVKGSELMEARPGGEEVEAGSLEELVKYVYSGATPTIDYIKVFLLTYRAFCSPFELLAALRAALAGLGEGEAAKAQKLRIFNFLRKWVEDCFYDFQDARLAHEFADTALVAQHLGPSFAQGLARKLEAARAFDPSQTVARTFKDPPPRPQLARALPARPSLTDLPPLELARQMALLDFALFAKIKPNECIGLAWTKPEKRVACANLLAVIERFNQTANWAVRQLVGEANLRRRAEVLKKLIKTAQHSLHLHNFHAVFSIMSGLGNAAAHRLKKTFALLGEKQRAALGELELATGADKSWKQYRTLLRAANPPYIPFLGVYQTDLTFIEEGNKTMLTPTTINFRKCQMIAAVILDLQQRQLTGYNFTELPPVRDYLATELAQPTSDDLLYDRSLAVEPREPA